MIERIAIWIYRHYPARVLPIAAYFRLECWLVRRGIWILD
jgi:hypothetical protein